jgi:hypothetical protein
LPERVCPFAGHEGEIDGLDAFTKEKVHKKVPENQNN